MRLRAAIGLVVVLASACYRYTPATNAPAAAGTVVRLQLTNPGAESMGRVLGRNTIAVDGTVLAADDTSLAMSVSATHQRGGQPLTWAGERVIVPRAAIQSVDSRSLDRKRTFAIVGLGILGAIAMKVVVAGIGALAGGDDGGISPTPP